MAKILWKLYYLVGESWCCYGTYDLPQEVEEAKLILKQQGNIIMIRRVLM